MMQINNQTPSVYMDFKKNEKGFTFISSLLMLSVIVLTIPFMSQIILLTQPDESYYDDVSVNEFYRFIRDEIIKSNSFQVFNKGLVLWQDDDRISIHRYEDIIRRTVNGGGHEIYLRNVEKFQVEESEFGVRLIVTDTKGNINEKTFIFYDE